MSEESQRYLFQSFKQADSSTTRKYGGSGLGLSITKKFCEILGGKIEVESKEKPWHKIHNDTTKKLVKKFKNCFFSLEIFFFYIFINYLHYKYFWITNDFQYNVR